MEDLISIVVPIYKVEDYLKICVDSIIGQTYKNLEIILVDDGSPDNCGIICDEYTKKDDRIKVIHKENGGLSDARNAGIDIAKGKYICFIDSDDYISEKYIEMLYNAIIKNNVKVSQCNIVKVDDAGNEIKKIGYIESQIKDRRIMIEEIYNKHWVENIVVWNKMYSIELFQDLRYPVGKINEDEFITYKILYNVDKVAIINNYLYKYRQNNNSIMGKKFSVKRFDALEALEERISFFIEKKDIRLYELTLEEYIKRIREYYIKTKLEIDNSKKIQKALIKKYRNNYFKLFFIKNISIIKKIKYSIFYFTPNLFYKIKVKKYK